MYQADPPQRRGEGSRGEGSQLSEPEGWSWSGTRSEEPNPTEGRAASSAVQAIWVTGVLASKVPLSMKKSSSKVGASHRVENFVPDFENL